MQKWSTSGIELLLIMMEKKEKISLRARSSKTRRNTC